MEEKYIVVILNKANGVLKTYVRNKDGSLTKSEGINYNIGTMKLAEALKLKQKYLSLLLEEDILTQQVFVINKETYQIID